MTNPKVSVLMSVYNGERHLLDSIDSILAQTFTDFEFIIINDGSTDTTGEILRSYADPRIKIVDQENVGLTKSLDKGIAMASGVYIARQDADDLSVKERFEKQVAFMDSNPAVALLGAQAVIIDVEGKAIAHCYHPTSSEFLKWRLLFRNTFIHTSVMIRRSLLEERGLSYNPVFIRSQDYDLWERINEEASVANLSEDLVYYREHEGNITSLEVESQEEFALDVSKRAIQNLIGRGVSYDEIRGLTNTFATTAEPIKSVDALVSKGMLLEEMLLVFQQKNKLDSKTREMVLGDALNRWLTMARGSGLRGHAVLRISYRFLKYRYGGIVTIAFIKRFLKVFLGFLHSPMNR